MVKIVLLLTRKPEITHEQFVDYWRHKHASIVRKVPYLKRYVISVRTKTIAGDPVPDGIAEIYFENMATLEVATSSAEWLAARADGANFRISNGAFVTEEYDLSKD